MESSFCAPSIFRKETYQTMEKNGKKYNPHGTRVWRSPRTRQEESIEESKDLTSEGFDERVACEAYSEERKILTSLGYINVRLHVSAHAEKQYRLRASSHDSKNLAFEVAFMLRTQELSNKIPSLNECQSLVVFDARSRFVLCMNVRSCDTEDTYDILIRTYYFMGFNKGKVFYVESKEAVCVEKDGEKLTLGIENIPQLQLNNRYRGNAAD